MKRCRIWAVTEKPVHCVQLVYVKRTKIVADCCAAAFTSVTLIAFIFARILKLLKQSSQNAYGKSKGC